MHILETIYLALIFVLRSIHDLAGLTRITANRHIYMILQTLASWIDAIVFCCLKALDDRCETFEVEELKAKLAISTLVHVYVC